MHSLQSQSETLVLRTFAKLTGLVVAASLLLLVLAVLASSAFAGPLVQVRPEVQATEDVVKLGDIFAGVEQNADHVLVNAPKASETLKWNAATLQKIATHFKLPYQANPADSVTITRASNAIPAQTLKELVVEALRAEGMDGRFDIQLNALPEGQDWVVPAQSTQAKIDRITVNREKGTFRTILKAGSETLVSDGLVIPLVAVPTLRRSLTPGDTIHAEDIVYIDMKLKDVRKDIILKANDLLGLTPRKPLAVGATVKANDVVAPRLVKRGDLVTLVFKNNRITLSTQGKAEEDGVLGGRVSVLNASSNRKVDGIVGPSGEVIVTN